MTEPTIPQAATPSVCPPPLTLPTWKIKLLYDGDCPLCLREVRFLAQRDAGRGLVDFVDITSPDYTPEANGGVEFAAAMGRLHAVLPDNRVIQNMEVLRQVYEVLDLGWVYGFSRWPWIRPLVDWSYDRWAEWRLAITGRPSLVTIVAARKQQLQTLNCDAPQRCIRNTD